MRALVPSVAPVVALAAALGMVAGCVSAPPKAPTSVVRTPQPTPVAPAPPPPLAADWRDWPVTPGTWSYARSGASTSATFGSVDRRLLVLSCDADRRVRLTRPDLPAGTITIRTSSTVRALAAQPATAPIVGATITLTPADPLLDAIGFSRGRFIVEQAGTPTLVIPAWAEIERVTEDCRG